jgi:hypothetical protein
LMAQVIAHCKAGGINFAATFELDPNEEDNVLFCSSALVGDGADPKLRRIYDILVERPLVAAITIARPNAHRP